MKGLDKNVEIIESHRTTDQLQETTLNMDFKPEITQFSDYNGFWKQFVYC